jgi:hypothetical protein
MSSPGASVHDRVRRFALVFLVACDQKAPAIHHEPAAVIEASAPLASVSASAAIEEPTPPPAPAGCRRAFDGNVTNAALRALVLGGTPGPKKATDCLGHEITFETPLALRVDRFTADATHLAVFVAVTKGLGYTSWCPGFAAIVRVDHDELVTEGVGPEQIDDCDNTNKLQTAMLDGHRALLFPHVTSNGEEGDFETAWSVSLPDDHGALSKVGSVKSGRSIGNGSITSGAWFGAMDATILGGDGLRVEERWNFVRETAGGTEQGKKRTLVRTYALENGKLVMSPKNDPTQ